MKQKLIPLSSLMFMFVIVFILILVSALVFNIYALIAFVILYLLSIVWAFVVVANKKRRFETRIRWFVFIVAAPFVGISAYIFFGRIYHYSNNNKYEWKNWEDIIDKAEPTDKVLVEKMINEKIPAQFRRAFQASLRQQNEIPRLNNDVKFLENGTDLWINVFEDIQKANDYVLLNFYIISDGHLLNYLTNILEKKIKQGVRVYIIYDYVGSFAIFHNSKKSLSSIGAKVIPYSKIYFPFIKWTANYRDHRKDIIIDGKVGYTGGINIADEYINLDKKMGLWQDHHVRIEGSCVVELEKIFASDWLFLTKNKFSTLEPTIGRVHEFTKELKNKDDVFQIISSGPNHQSQIHLDTYMTLITAAQKRIWLTTPYFIPPLEIINALSSAAKSGVDVRIFLPELTDKGMILDVSYRWTRQLFLDGVKIYALNNTFYHGKTMLVDDEISIVGSTNLDFRSLFSDQQTLCIAKSKKLTKEIDAKYKDNINYSFEFDFLPNSELGKWKLFCLKIANIFYPLM